MLRDKNISFKDHNSLVDAVKTQWSVLFSEGTSKVLSECLRLFCVQLNKKYQDSSRNIDYFLKKESQWLEGTFSWPESVENEFLLQQASTSKDNLNPRPLKQFGDLSTKQKKRRTLSLTHDTTFEELAFATKLKSKMEGRKELSKIIEHLLENDDDVKRVSDFLFKTSKKPSGIHPEKSLALMTSLKLSTYQYNTLRDFTIEHMGNNILPSYYKLKKEKENCYPPQEDVVVTEKMAKIRLQSILDLTAKRIVKICNLNIQPNSELILTTKWGFDGASSQSLYKQKFEDPESSEQEESSVFMTSCVPLDLKMGSRTIWENPAPASTRYCRPIKFEFIKESAEMVTQQFKDMQTEIENLIPTYCNVNIIIKHDLHLTMIDGKIRTIISKTSSSSTCPICLTKPSEMNNLLDVYKKPLREDIYKYGLSTLHLWIRCMECLLHIAYNIDFKSWSAKGENKTLKEERKKAIQKAFRDELGIIVDVVKQGHGTTNDGNTARTFFRNHEVTSRITGIDSNLIYRFAVILQVTSCEKKINFEKFRAYLNVTAEMYVSLYTWYYMPSSVHILLIHGADICKHFNLIPIGKLTEEASEARNKEFRTFRQNFSRKIGRKQNMEDILHNLLISSDPLMSSIRRKYSWKKKFSLYPEAQELLNDMDMEVGDEDKDSD